MVTSMAANGGVSGSGGAGRTALLNIVMQLRKACNHPYLFPNVEDRTLPPLGDHLVTAAGKLVLLDRLLARCGALQIASILLLESEI